MTEALVPTSIFERYPVLNEIPKDRFPQHVFIIPDGNRRSAAQLGKEPLEGHQSGLQKTLEILRVMQELPVNIVTLWGFSADNWRRPDDEKSGLMDLFGTNIPLELPELIGYNARFVHLGRKDRIPMGLANTLNEAQEKTKNNTGQIVCVAIDFGGQDHTQRLVQGAAEIAARTAREHPEMTTEQIAQSFTQERIIDLSDTSGLIPPADLIIRTSEERTSDVGWINGPQTELYFLPDMLFPNLTESNIVDAMIYFSKKTRRLGS